MDLYTIYTPSFTKKSKLSISNTAAKGLFDIKDKKTLKNNNMPINIRKAINNFTAK